MDYLSVSKFDIPIELMMENAGLQLARLVTHVMKANGKVFIGIGTGNNGGGGLVAARRLAGWGYSVFLDLPEKVLKPLPEIQYKRALAAGAKDKPGDNPDIFIDAYLGFSQHLPLSENFQYAVERANRLPCPKISLDIPTGFHPKKGTSEFNPGIILTLGAMKTELLSLAGHTSLLSGGFGSAVLNIPGIWY